jgi:predicted ABC-class ATPase
MQPATNLERKVRGINGRDYGAYQALKGPYQYDGFGLVIQQIPKDPYAPPHTGIYRVQVPWDRVGLERARFRAREEAVAVRDFFARRFYEASAHLSETRRGTGFSGVITIDRPSQAILERSSVVLDERGLEVRCFVGLPANGRNINGPLAIQMLLTELPDIVRGSLFRGSYREESLEEHLQVAADAAFLRQQLPARGLVAFVADGAILPRISGISQQPLSTDRAVPFQSPESLRHQLTLPSGRTVSGMGIPAGITLVTGGGYHGKSTLLETIEQGIYNHVAGDGREACVCVPETIKVRAYSGRYVEQADISGFIGALPLGKDTASFSTANASGSTSQAAGIAEAVEVGAKVLLMDEDTCATNFMIRDRNMQQLVAKQDEPITAFIDRVRKLHDENGISTILVLGGVGDYFEVADTVIQLKEYRPHDVTERAREIIASSPSPRVAEEVDLPIVPGVRIPDAASVDVRNQYGKRSLYATELTKLHFGRHVLDLTDLEQLVDLSQTKALGHAMLYATRLMDGKRSLAEVVARVMADIDAHGLDILSDRISGHFAAFPYFALAGALNRLSGFKVTQR